MTPESSPSAAGDLPALEAAVNPNDPVVLSVQAVLNGRLYGPTNRAACEVLAFLRGLPVEERMEAMGMRPRQILNYGLFWGEPAEVWDA